MEKVRTSSRALARLEELAVARRSTRRADGVDIAVHHLDAAARADGSGGATAHAGAGDRRGRRRRARGGGRRARRAGHARRRRVAPARAALLTHVQCLGVAELSRWRQGSSSGAVNPATIVARVRRQGPATQGSGNPGATNAGRVLGRGGASSSGCSTSSRGWCRRWSRCCGWGGPTAYAVGLAVRARTHLVAVPAGRGGKGVATSLGAILAVFPLLAVGLVVLFGLILWRTRWVAGASLSAAGALAVWALFGPLPEPVLVGRLWGLAVALLIVARHEPNIRAWVRQRRA